MQLGITHFARLFLHQGGDVLTSPLRDVYLDVSWLQLRNRRLPGGRDDSNQANRFMTLYRIVSISLIMLLLAASLCNADDRSKYHAIVDSLRRIPSSAPTVPDPVSYQDEATYGTFKPLHPPRGLDEPLDSTRTLIPGWRIRVGETADEAAAKQLIEHAQRALNAPVQVRYYDDHYEVLAGNFVSESDALTLLNAARNAGFTAAVTTPSLVLLPLESRRSISHRDTVWQVQIGAFTSRAAADSMMCILQRATSQPVEITPFDAGYRVRVGRFATSTEAAACRDSLSARGFPNGWITTVR